MPFLSAVSTVAPARSSTAATCERSPNIALNIHAIALNIQQVALNIHTIALNVQHVALNIHTIALNVQDAALSIHTMGGESP
eukprot:7880892-Pyramimonas_sp.AAC.1